MTSFRMRSWSIAALAAAALAAQPALGADAPKKPPEQGSRPGKKADDKEKLECSYTEVAGTLMRKRVCFTAEQIRLQREATEDLARERRELGGGAYPERNISSLSPSGKLNGGP